MTFDIFSSILLTMKSHERKKEIELSDKNCSISYQGTMIQIEEKNFVLSDGKHSYDIVRHPGASVIIPVDQDGKLILIKQYRLAVEKILLEFPAGCIEKNESPEETATRELQEETHLKANKLTFLASQYPSSGFSDEILHYYLAEDLTHSYLPSEDGDFLDIVKFSLDELHDLLREGKLMDGKTIAGLYYYEKLVRY